MREGERTVGVLQKIAPTLGEGSVRDGQTLMTEPCSVGQTGQKMGFVITHRKSTTPSESNS